MTRGKLLPSPLLQKYEHKVILPIRCFLFLKLTKEPKIAVYFKQRLWKNDSPLFFPGLPRCSSPDLGKLEMFREGAPFYALVSGLSYISVFYGVRFQKTNNKFRKHGALYEFQFLQNLWAETISKGSSTFPSLPSVSVPPQPQQVHLYHI